MPDRRVIYDSEDEDEGFSPINSPAKSDRFNVSLTAGGDLEAGGETRAEAPTSDARSTDPEFFKRIYEEHQQHAAAESVPDTARQLEVAQFSSDKQRSSNSNAKGNNSSSITDPTLRSAKRRTTKSVDAKDLASLTQVTTPSAPKAKMRDIYDFPGSDEEGAVAEPSDARTVAKKSKTYSKRKRGRAVDTSSPQPAMQTPHSPPSQLLPVESGESRSTRKKRKTSLPQQNLDEDDGDVDLLVVPTTADMDGPSTKHQKASGDSDSVVPDTLDMHEIVREPPPASFFIVPPATLTASQKQEYLQLSDCSELDVGESQHQDSLPLPRAHTQGQLPPNSESTIAYTTPSRYYSSAVPLPVSESVENRSSSSFAAATERRTQVERKVPHSSPDELNSNPPEQPMRSAKRRRTTNDADKLAQDESRDSDEIEYSREQNVARSSRRRAEAGLESVTESAQVERGVHSTGEKRKEGNLDPAGEDFWDSDNIGYGRENYAPRPSKRRSRAVPDDGEEAEPLQQSLPDTLPPGQASLREMNDVEPASISPGHEVPQDIAGSFEGLDPNFLAAMPEDIRKEIIADHLSQKSGRDSQAARTRSRGRPSETTGGLSLMPEESQQPKKRGRKKKESHAEAAETETAPASTSPAKKKKRGRPKKSESIQTPPAPDDGEEYTVAEADQAPEVVEEVVPEPFPDESTQLIPAVTQPSKRGRKKKTVNETLPTLEDTNREPGGSEGETTQDVSNTIEEQVEPLRDAGESAEIGEGRDALRDISNSASQDLVSQKATSEKQKDRPDAKETDVTKSASTTCQQGKVPMRVGLSKKSRIAPLLKIIRK